MSGSRYTEYEKAFVEPARCLRAINHQGVRLGVAVDDDSADALIRELTRLNDDLKDAMRVQAAARTLVDTFRASATPYLPQGDLVVDRYLVNSAWLSELEAALKPRCVRDLEKCLRAAAIVDSEVNTPASQKALMLAVSDYQRSLRRAMTER